MDSSDGEWVDLPGPDGDVRRVWRPDEQPPSPDGGFGSWYLVSEEGEDRPEWVSAWHWTEAPAAPVVAEPAAASRPAEQRLMTRRFVLGWAAATAAAAGLVVGIDALHGGDRAPDQTATAADLARDIGVSFDRFAVTDDVYDGKHGGLAVTFVNQGKTARTFWTSIQADGLRGVIAVETIAVQNLKPGESTTQTAFAANPQVDALAAATFRVTATEGRPPPL